MDEFGALLIALVVAAFFGLGYGVYKGCNPDPPAPCVDYSYKLSRLPFNEKVAVCNKWSDMDMKIEKVGIIGGQMVHCSCTDQSIDLQ